MANLVRKFAGTILLLVLVSANSSAADTEIHNSAAPAEPPQTMTLEELWRIGGEDDEESLLGVISKVFADDTGRLYLLDIQLVEVHVYDKDGEYAGSLGKRGDGPGELRSVADALFMPDGTLGLVQPFPGRVVKVDRDGIPAGEVRPGGDDPTAGGFLALRSAAVSGSDLVVSGIRISRGEKSRTATHFIGHLAANGAESNRFLEKTTVREFGSTRIVEVDEFFPHGDGWTLTPDGDIIIAPERNEYRLDIRDRSGALKKSVTREYESVKRTAEEMAEAETRMTPRRRRNRGDFSLEMAPTEPDIIRFHTDAEGNLWVLPSRGIRHQEPGIHSTWDIFDRDGRFARQVSLACDASGRDDAIFFPGHGLVVVVRQYREALKAFRGRNSEEDEAAADEMDAAPLEVVCYRMAPKS